MNKDKKWFSLPLAMWLVIIISLLAITILEYIIPFSRDIKWVENSSKAYYQASSWIEEWLYYVYERNGSWSIDNTGEDWNELTWSAKIDYGYNTTSSGIILPPDSEWNSEYDAYWNIISAWNPVQLSIWDWGITTNFKVAFRVPNLDNSNIVVETLSWWTLAMVNWQLSASNDTLNSSWSIIQAKDVLDSDDIFSDFVLWNKNWIILDWSVDSFDNFYRNNCNNSWSGCTLKFSVVNKLKTDNLTNSVIIPYLEWRIELDSTKNIPLRYTKIESSWKAIGYRKDLEVKVASNTVNEAFDFTIFQ